MSVKGPQDFWVVGSRVFVRRDPIAGVVQPLLDLGVIKEISPQNASEQAELMDPDGGSLRLVDSEQTQFSESYQITCANFNNNNLALLLNADPPGSFTQAATPQVDVAHWGIPGHLVQIVDAAGIPVYNIASIENVQDDETIPTVYVEGTDWEVVDLMRGLIRMIDGGTFAAADNLEISFTPVALSGDRLVLPQTNIQAVRADTRIFLARSSGQEQHVRECRTVITPDSVNLASADDFSDFVLNMQVINDLTNLVQPAGRMLSIAGDLPSKS